MLDAGKLYERKLCVFFSVNQSRKIYVLLRTPAVHCSMPEIDRIFSRIGTSDDIQASICKILQNNEK